MDPAADDVPTEFLDPVEDEIGENIVDESVNVDDMLQVEHEEVLEEIVEGGEMMYDEEGRLIEYVYEDGTEVIEEFVEVEGDANGDFAFVVLDEHGERRLVKQSELEIKKSMPELMDERGGDGEGPSSPNIYHDQKRGRMHGNHKAPETMRDLLKQGGIGRMMYGGYYADNRNKPRIHNLAKVDVEKYVPPVTVNRRPLPDNPDFSPAKKPRSRKNPPWQEDVLSGRPSSSRRTPSPAVLKDPLFPEDEEMVIRFKCPECGLGFPTMAMHCNHMSKVHDCPTTVREGQFFLDREFENFFIKLEKTSMLREGINPTIRKKTRAQTSQTFVCNYMKKDRGKNPEFAEVGLAALAERPEEVCTAFVQKVHTYECVRINYCDQHIHHDGNIGFRVPLGVKRRMFEMAFKRLPIPCMQLLLGLEAENLLPHPTRFEQKLKNFSHVEIVELMEIINGTLKKNPVVEHPIPKSKRIAIRYDTFPMPSGTNSLIVRRLNPPKPDVKLKSLETEAAPEEEEEEEEEDVEGADGFYEESMLYDPENNRDPLLDELTENELAVLEAYERDICVPLTDDQKRDRMRNKIKFSLQKVLQMYTSLDATSHSITPTDMHIDSINKLREMASFVVEIGCQVDAEVKSQFNSALRIDEIKRDMIAGIAMQERSCQPDRRRRSGQPLDPMQKYSDRIREHDEYSDRMFLKTPPQRSSSGSYNLTSGERHIQMLRHMHNPHHEQIEDKPSLRANPNQPIIPDELKGTAYTKPTRRRQPADPNQPPRKRVRKEKPKEPDVSTPSAMEPEAAPEVAEAGPIVEDAQEAPTVSEEVAPSAETTQPEPSEAGAVPSAPSPSPAPSTSEDTSKIDIDASAQKDDKPESDAATPATKTRTGRVVKPKKWGDE